MKGRYNSQNPYSWTRSITNFLRDEEYDATHPWIYKVKKNGKIATEIYQYADDGQITGETEEESWRGSDKIAKTCAYKGVQDAARKRRQPSKSP